MSSAPSSPSTTVLTLRGTVNQNGQPASRLNIQVWDATSNVPLGIIGAGAGNIIGAGAGNIIGAGAGNIFGAGAGNIIGAGAGNVIGAGAGNIIGAGGGHIIGAGAGNIVGTVAGNIIGAGAGNIIGAGAGNIIGAGAGNIIGAGAGNIIGAGAGNIIGAGAGNIIGAGAGNVIAAGSSRVIQVSAGNIIGAGAGNIIGAGAGNIIGAGAGNFRIAEGGAQQPVLAIASLTPVTDAQGRYQVSVVGMAPGQAVRLVATDGSTSLQTLVVATSRTAKAYHVRDLGRPKAVEADPQAIVIDARSTINSAIAQGFFLAGAKLDAGARDGIASPSLGQLGDLLGSLSDADLGAIIAQRTPSEADRTHRDAARKAFSVLAGVLATYQGNDESPITLALAQRPERLAVEAGLLIRLMSSPDPSDGSFVRDWLGSLTTVPAVRLARRIFAAGAAYGFATSFASLDQQAAAMLADPRLAALPKPAGAAGPTDPGAIATDLQTVFGAINLALLDLPTFEENRALRSALRQAGIGPAVAQLVAVTMHDTSNQRAPAVIETYLPAIPFPGTALELQSRGDEGTVVNRDTGKAVIATSGDLSPVLVDTSASTSTTSSGGGSSSAGPASAPVLNGTIK